MTSMSGLTDQLSEYCPSCGTERPHGVSVTLVTESDETDNAAYSREPYRVSECLNCGRRTERRMNDA
ncbi:DUF7835 family putative zinc beta-ribbon protein [Halorhabdus rudnickae]|uniref:DUF7835 family putative zinc beta-ribbon protein n=1 Tax=Halorhabdus rudnickae TaxID=1775544 RepID=UPI0010847D36|nr:hypothetical protein [Halorhabdus rudnickae]